MIVDLDGLDITSVSLPGWSLHGSLAVACGVLGRTPTPKAGANACGGLWRRKICGRRVAAGFGNAIRENYYTHGRCKRLRWPVRFAEERDAGMGGPKVNLTFNPLAKLHPVIVNVFLVFSCFFPGFPRVFGIVLIEKSMFN